MAGREDVWPYPFHWPREAQGKRDAHASEYIYRQSSACRYTSASLVQFHQISLPLAQKNGCFHQFPTIYERKFIKKTAKPLPIQKKIIPLHSL